MNDNNQTNLHDPERIAFLEKELRYIAGIIKQKGREILNSYTITPPQFVALQWLFEHGDMTIGDLSNKMYLAFSTTTDLVDRMEKNELVVRIREEQDRRVVRIKLLKEGERIIEEVIKKRQDYLENVLADFDGDEVEQLSFLLEKLHNNMK
ncbi:MarR family transcriptional regulator [Planococcus glaciei]|uniref:MarR family transcriptional regulator n=2 Tax=Planococcus TaxID=1372 RepID=A0A1G8KAZ2_9BACL|nr:MULTISPECIES: MarR family transcriptional regulator [Planococcus]ETP68865.1 MarR family transcriptional regulator [Planococcus glaciei CHR43]KOF11754.1 MarR family transcriptional regulator [Planococcus glaciei]MBX0315114.1 MarR family transcriptional regulator [Planococcus glaciei]MDN7227000.1 MarR family transcriptional regulator [Planococcus sp. N064]QKX51688.1 MarR family transcriptional regulator [Planococcus glaciei]